MKPPIPLDCPPPSPRDCLAWAVVCLGLAVGVLVWMLGEG